MRTETLDRSRGGMWPWLGQRVTAVVIIVTIMVHLVLTHFVSIGELSYDNIGERLASGAVLANDVLLLLAVVYHALNGVRMVVLDWGLSGKGVRRGFDVVPLGRRLHRRRLRHLGPLGLGELRGSGMPHHQLDRGRRRARRTPRRRRGQGGRRGRGDPQPGPPGAQPLRRRAGRHQRRAGQRPGRPRRHAREARLRHRQGQRLPRPTRTPPSR